MYTENNLTGLYKIPQAERLEKLEKYSNLMASDLTALSDGLSIEQADAMIENVVGRYALPLGLATNFLIDGQEVLVPMAVEEPSIVAGVSYAAKLTRSEGGFLTRSSEPVMIGQVQVLDVPNLDDAAERINASEANLLAAPF